jgi:hypothetical protein
LACIRVVDGPGPWSLLCVGAWVVASVAYGGLPSLARVAALAGALYVMHAAAALAAVLPYDCVLPPGVVAALGRAAGAAARDRTPRPESAGLAFWYER